ncbi:MAG: GGDEF domain-containing protein [Clostridia bacterium]|nr:GGDEF domain-containing protein [Clostridia bacterium]
MDKRKKIERQDILKGIYQSSMGISQTTLTVVAVLEVFMLIYTLLNPELYGSYIWVYRLFYIALLSVALTVIVLNIHVRADIDHRYRILNVVYPLCSVFFFGWTMGITYFDLVKHNVLDPTVFMTFSLTVPLCFYLYPTVYTGIMIPVDLIMAYITASHSAGLGPMINLSIFFVFQLVLGISFLRLKVQLTERILEEHQNADIDVLTGLKNRRAYEEELDKYEEIMKTDGLIYISIDLNGLKEANDSHGHEIGDRLIASAAQCIQHGFGSRGNVYRIGGDEFIVLISAAQDEMNTLTDSFDKCLEIWPGVDGIRIRASYGAVASGEFPEFSVSALARVADERMYQAKERYYRSHGNGRRRTDNNAMTA